MTQRCFLFDPKLDVSGESFLRIYEMLTIKLEIRNWAGIRGKFGFFFRVKCMKMLFHSPLEINVKRPRIVTSVWS